MTPITQLGRCEDPGLESGIGIDDLACANHETGPTCRARSSPGNAGSRVSVNRCRQSSWARHRPPKAESGVPLPAVAASGTTPDSACRSSRLLGSASYHCSWYQLYSPPRSRRNLPQNPQRLLARPDAHAKDWNHGDPPPRKRCRPLRRQDSHGAKQPPSHPRSAASGNYSLLKT